MRKIYTTPTIFLSEIGRRERNCRKCYSPNHQSPEDWQSGGSNWFTEIIDV